jgi:MFS family permease
MQGQKAPAGFLFWLSLAQLVSWGSTVYLFPLLMQPMEQVLHINRAQSSLAMSLALLAEGIVAFGVGRLIDAGHARIVMTLGSCLVAICLWLQSRVVSLVEFYLVWSVMGAALACVLYNPAFAVVTRRFPSDYRRAIIVLTFLGGLASTVFIPLIAWLMARWGWSVTCVILASIHILLCAPAHWLLLQNEPQKASTMLYEPIKSTEISLADKLRSPTFLFLTLFIISGLAVTAAVPTHLVTLLRERGLDESWAIAIPAMIGVLQVVGRALVYKLDHRVNQRKADLLIVTLMPVAICILLLPSASLMLALLFATIFGVANGTMTIVKGTAIARYMGSQHVATLNGAMGLPVALGRAGAPLLLGILWSPTAGYLYGIIMLFAMSLSAFIFFYCAQKSSRLTR